MQQALSNEAFREAASLTKEFQVKNNNATSEEPEQPESYADEIPF